MSALFFYSDKKDIKSDLKETERYLGYRRDSEISAEMEKKISGAIQELQELLTPESVYAEFDLTCEGENISFADLNFSSRNLSGNLRNCSKVILFAATIGAKVDMRIRRAQMEGSASAAIFQAAGAMFIESFVDKLNQKIKDEYKEKGFRSHPRYSPGYGDVSLEMQKEFFRLLPAKRIGLTLMESLVMAPEKSVTAFIGLEKLRDEVK